MTTKPTQNERIARRCSLGCCTGQETNTLMCVGVHQSTDVLRHAHPTLSLHPVQPCTIYLHLDSRHLELRMASDYHWLRTGPNKGAYKGKGAYSSSWNSPQNYGTSLANRITQYYLPPDRDDRPAFTPTGQVGTRFIDPVRMKGWVSSL